MKKLLLTLTLCGLSLAALAQAHFGEKPKLVVGIVVDQMRWDYLSRFYDDFTNDGFRRLIDNGFSCDNCLINYVPTVTAIGHTSAYTGTTPAFHGVCGNSYYIDGRKVVSCQDDSVSAVGSNSAEGNRSPRNMVATTIGDQLRLHTDFQSKVVGISYKDRAAIFPAGHSATAAYWLDRKNMCFISSTYYMAELPKWVANYNKQLSKNKEARKAGENISMTPLCGTITTDMAIAALEGEQLGQGGHTDMLCVSYSQTDVIGHEYGTRDTRTNEAYLQLDRDLKRLFQAIDQRVGKGNWLVFLTADHGAAHNWNFMRQHKLPAGPLYMGDIRQAANAWLSQKLGAKAPIVIDELNYRFFLDHEAIAREGLDEQAVRRTLVDYLRSVPGIVTAIDYEEARQSAIPDALLQRLLMGYYPGRSGDVIAIPLPQHYSWWSTAVPTHTTHGEWNPYDAHIPCLFYGWKVPHGATSRQVSITDIAPTVCQLLHIQQPNACTGQAIVEITK